MNLKQKIIIISPAHPLRGGIAASGERLAYAFQAQGHAVKIYTFSLQYPNFLFPGKTQYSTEPKPTDLDITIGINSINPLSWWRVGRQIAKEKPDLVVCRFWLPFMAPALGSVLRIVKKRFNKTKIIGLVDNIIPHEKRFGDRPFAQYFTKICDGFIVMSRSVEQEMSAFTRKPVKYIPHPIYDTYGEKVSRTEALSFLQLPDNQQYILFFGLVRRYKGLDLLLEALAILENNNRDLKNPIKLIVAGEFYEDENFYRDLIKTLKIENAVIIRAEYIPTEEVKYYFGVADLVVQPYRTATQSGISQIAYHFEKPMVVSNVGGLPEIVAHGEAGYVVEPTPPMIAEAIADFFKNNKAALFIPKVVEQKKRFSWEVMVDGFLSFIT